MRLHKGCLGVNPDTFIQIAHALVVPDFFHLRMMEAGLACPFDPVDRLVLIHYFSIRQHVKNVKVSASLYFVLHSPSRGISRLVDPGLKATRRKSCSASTKLIAALWLDGRDECVELCLHWGLTEH